jgi:acetyl-CoA/propionyl-CoA carboxylase
MAALSAMLSDFVLMVKDTSDMRIASFSEEADEDENGAAWMHAKNSGCCDLIAENDEDCLKQCRDLLGFLPSNNNGIIRQHATDDRPDRKEEELMTIVPVDQSKTYNMKKLIALLVDNGNFLEIKRHWAANLIVGFARLDGYSVGIVANNPQNRGGCMDMNAADKMARFVRFCDAFHIPLIWLIDTPAFLPAVEEERGGIIRHGAKVVSANSLATVPQISVYIRKCYGGGNLAMPGENLGGDMTFAWPTAVVSPMIPDGAVAILYRKEIQAAENPAKIHEERVKEFEKSTGGILWRCIPVQEFIDPRETRFVLIKALRRLSDKHEETAWRRHDNIPL